MRVLIVEDEPISRRVLARVLERKGYKVTACENGTQGWELYRQRNFRLVIADWVMPEMDGLELCRKIRQINYPDYCYYILLTAKTGKAYFLEAMDSGVDDYLTKPLDTDEINVRVRVAERILALQTDLKILRHTFPICAWCKRVRDDDTLWHSVEKYIASHSLAEVSHSICPDCQNKQLAAYHPNTSPPTS
jgi:sigma-B regulation protein RsbU (phosphoserine phosphatase)